MSSVSLADRDGSPITLNRVLYEYLTGDDYDELLDGYGSAGMTVHGETTVNFVRNGGTADEEVLSWRLKVVDSHES